MAVDGQRQARLQRLGQGGIGGEPAGIADHRLRRGRVGVFALVPRGEPGFGLTARFGAGIEGSHGRGDPVAAVLPQGRIREDAPRALDGRGRGPVVVDRQPCLAGASLQGVPARLPGRRMVGGRLTEERAVVAGQEGVGTPDEIREVRGSRSGPPASEPAARPDSTSKRQAA